jgi:hypothetical protein
MLGDYTEHLVKAAENRKPPLGIGLTERTFEQSETEKSNLQDGKRNNIAADASGKSEKRHAGGSNDGMSSANPRVISGDEDGNATFPIKSKR